MTELDGTVRLEWSIDAITVGRRHRKDLGDLDALAASIESDGLLQPPTITPDGVLICGARRLAALRQLGYRTVSVWVRAGISNRLRQLMAEQADNALHKPLSQTEAADLYRELKALMAADAARRQEATRFHSKAAAPHDGTTADQRGSKPPSDGGAAAAPPVGPPGKSRAQAAQMVTGRYSYTSLEQINDLQEIATDPSRPADVREYARIELESIDAGGSIRDAHARARAVSAGSAGVSGASDRPSREELQAMAEKALVQAKAVKKAKRRTGSSPAVAGEPVRLPIRAFVHIWDDLDGWWARFDAGEVAQGLSPEQWRRFETTIAGTNQFFTTARRLRTAGREECA